MRIAAMTLGLALFGQVAVAQGPGMRRQELQQQGESFGERAEIARRELSLWRSLEGQMRPGLAADPDSLTTIMNGIITAQEERAALTRAELEQFETFLEPVQRAQVMLAWHRLQMQIDRILQGRGGQQMRRQGS